MAREKSEAGDFYNNSTIQYIKNQIVAFIGVEEFPIKDKVKDFLFQISNEIMEEGIKNKNEINIEKNIMIKSKEKYKLKNYLVDELGLNVFVGSAFKPKYRYYKDNEKKKFIIEIEMCGGTRNLKCKCINLGENYRFHIEGVKTFNTINPKSEVEPTYDKTDRRNGNFSFDIIVSTKLIVDFIRKR